MSRYWNLLALDGSNWQKVDLFDFQVDIEVNRLPSVANIIDFDVHTMFTFLRDQWLKTYRKDVEAF